MSETFHEFHIDPSLLKESSCQQKLNLIHNQGLTTALESYKMCYGTAGHKFNYGWASGKSLSESKTLAFDYFLPKAQHVPDGDFRTIDHLVKTLDAYALTYPQEYETLKPKVFPSGELALELSTVMPLEMFLEPSNYQELYALMNQARVKFIICFTVDFLGSYLDEDCFVDRKYTALWNQQGFFESFRLNIQMMSYSWMLRKLGFSTTWLPCMIDAIFLKNPTDRHRDKVTGKLVPNTNWTGATFKRSNFIDFHDEQMEKYESWLVARLATIALSHMSNCYTENYTCCETVYGPCQFKEICLAKKDKQEQWLKNYERREYRPWEFQS